MRLSILVATLLVCFSCSDNASDAFIARLNILAKPVKLHLKHKKEWKGNTSYELVLQDAHGKYHYFHSSYGNSLEIYFEHYEEGEVIAEKPQKDNL